MAFFHESIDIYPAFSFVQAGFCITLRIVYGTIKHAARAGKIP